MIVQNKLTPLSRQEASRALLAAYLQLTGAAPSPAVLALLLAQSALETGNWQKIHNFNFGNAKAGVDYPLIVQFRCSEVDGQGAEHFYDPPDPHCNFRAYNDAAAGALDCLKVLHSRPHWWQGLHTESPSAFVDALATPPKYFTANPEPYKRTVTALFGQFLPLAEVALAIAAVVVPAPRSSSDLPPSESSGAPSVRSSANNNGAGKDPASVLPKLDPLTNGKPSPTTAQAPSGSATFWQQLISFLRWLIELFFRLRPPGSP